CSNGRVGKAAPLEHDVVVQVEPRARSIPFPAKCVPQFRAESLGVERTLSVDAEIVDTELPLQRLAASAYRASPEALLVIGTIVEGAGVEGDELGADTDKAPGRGPVSHPHTIEASFDVQTGAGRNQPRAANFYLLTSDDYANPVLLSHRLAQLEEHLVQVEGISIRRPRRPQRTVDDAALQLAKHAEPLSEPQIGPE